MNYDIRYSYIDLLTPNTQYFKIGRELMFERANEGVYPSYNNRRIVGVYWCGKEL